MANGDESVIINLKLNFIGGGEGAKAVMIYILSWRSSCTPTLKQQSTPHALAILTHLHRLDGPKGCSAYMNRPVEWVSARAAELFGRDWTQQPPDATVVVQFPVVDLARRFTCPSGFRCVAMVAAAFVWRWLRWLLESMRGLHRRSRRRRCCSHQLL